MQNKILKRFEDASIILKNTQCSLDDIYVNIEKNLDILQKALDVKEVLIIIKSCNHSEDTPIYKSYFFTLFIEWAKYNGYKIQTYKDEIKIVANKPIYQELMSEYGAHVSFGQTELLQKDSTFKKIDTLSAVWIDIIPCFKSVADKEFYTILIHSRDFHQYLLSSKSLFDIILTDKKYLSIANEMENFWCQ